MSTTQTTSSRQLGDYLSYVVEEDKPIMVWRRGDKPSDAIYLDEETRVAIRDLMLEREANEHSKNSC